MQGDETVERRARFGGRNALKLSLLKWRGVASLRYRDRLGIDIFGGFDGGGGSFNGVGGDGSSGDGGGGI